MRPLVALLLLAPLAVSAQNARLEVRTWQLQPGGMFLIGLTPIDIDGDVEMRIHSDGPIGPVPFAPIRLDAALAIYRSIDSIRVYGTVLTGRVTDFDGVRRANYRATIEEQRAPVALAAPMGEPVWLYPFGRPEDDEGTIAFEILPAGSAPLPSHYRVTHTYLTDATNLRIDARPAPSVRVRVAVAGSSPEIATTETLAVLRPLHLPVRGRDRRAGIELVLTPASWTGADRTGRCFVWHWTDGDPPGGGICLRRDRRDVVSQNIFGSGGLILHIEPLP